MLLKSKEELYKIDIGDFNFDLKEKEDENFILTEEAKKRLQKIKNLFDSKILVLLEGPTGTSKTKTIQILCKILGKQFRRFNLNNETTIEDLFGRLGSRGEDSWSNLDFIPGPFTEAFIKGYVFLLDEINLGSKSILQCLEKPLDTGKIILDIPGYGRFEHDKHKDFICVATQNPKLGGFINQREELSYKFISRFQVVEFPEIKIDELKRIAEGIAAKNNYKNKEIVESISNLHYQWVYKEKESKTSSQCFTIRDIKTTIIAISSEQIKEDPGDAINCFYGSRYRGEAFNHLMDIIKTQYPLIYKDIKLIPELPKDFPKCFSNFSLRKAFYFANIAKKNHRHLLIVGKEGSGLTQIGKWFSYYFTPEEKRKENFLFIFSPETTVSDLVGKNTPNSDIEKSAGLFEWKDGPLTLAVKSGYSGVFDNIYSAPTKVIESLNSLLEPRDTEEDYKFEIRQNIKEPEIVVHKNFLFIATCPLSKINDLSPALLNRFTIINLEDQLENATIEEEKEAIKFIIESENIILKKKDELIDKIHTIYKEMSLNMASLSKFVKATVKLIKLIENEENIEEIINYTKDITLTEKNDITIPTALQMKANEIFKNEQLIISNDERFYFQNSPNLKNLMTHIYFCSICQIPVCLVGATGLGKTSMARAFSEIVRREIALSYSFHMETQLSDLYGVYNFESGKSVFQDGPIVRAMENGQVFIADELNLGDESILQTMSIALEPGNEDFDYYVPDTGERKKRKNSFFFIVCQNDLSTSGRRKLPDIIQKRLRIFEYPTPNVIDLENSIEEMIKFEKSPDSKLKLYINFPYRIANFMLKLNEINIKEIGKWSMRNIRKLFRRITRQQQINESSYFNITIEHQIVFYILASIPGGIEKKLEIFDKISEILKETFDLDDNLRDKIKNCIESKPRIIKKIIDGREKIFLVKGDSEETLKLKKQNNKIKKYTDAVGEAGILLEKEIKDSIEISSIYESLFYVLFSHYKEPILLCGPSGYKSKLAKDILPDASSINFYPEISNSELIGNISLLSTYQSKEYYLEQICKISKSDEKLEDLKKELRLYYIEKEKDITQKKEKLLREKRKKKAEEEKDKIKPDLKKDIKEMKDSKKITNKTTKKYPIDDNVLEKNNEKLIKEKEKRNNKKKKEEVSEENSEDDIKNIVKNISDDSDYESGEESNDLSNDKNENDKDLIDYDLFSPINKDVIKKFENKISDIILNSKKKNLISNIFVRIVEQLKKNLFEFNMNLNEESLGDFTSVFKTGILTEKILSQSPLITENLPNLPPAVIERCNDLFNYNPKINLSEDTSNTFTGENKELSDFSDTFRIIATSNELAIKNLSDAAQSRFSIIYTTSYTKEERKFLIRNLYPDIPDNFYIFIEKFKEIFNKDLPFLYITKILKILKLLNKQFENPSKETKIQNLYLAINLAIKFNMDNEMKQKRFGRCLDTVFSLNNLKMNNEIDDENDNYYKDDDPFEYKDGELYSKFSDLSIKSSKIKKIENTKIAFVQPFNDLLEYIFISISLHFPLIIEGGTGKGKKTAIYYIAKVLHYKVIYFNISNTTTVDDLFCKKMPIEKNGNIIFDDIRSLLLDAIDREKNKKNCIIILDNIQNASSNVLESLIPLFDIEAKSLLVQGKQISKGTYNLIGIIDSSKDYKNTKDFLPNAIKHSAILFRNSEYLERKYCKKIISKIFNEKEEVDKIIDYYLDSYISLVNYSKEKQINELFTFNDFKKFYFFMENSKIKKNGENVQIFDIQTITQLLLVYKFKSKEEIDSANKILKYPLISDFWPIFTYEHKNNQYTFNIALNNRSEKLSFPIKVKGNKELLNAIHSLTPDQRRGIIFLMLSVLSDVPCIIQGVTASGKTHLIRLFCKLLGQNPLIINVNNDTGISILLNQLVPKDYLEEKKINDILKLIKELIEKEKENFKEEIVNEIIDLNNSENWHPSHFKKLLKYLETNELDFAEENFNLSSKLKSLLKEQLSFFKHLSNKESDFVEAMKIGQWVIIDGIESAQPELYQRLSSLCDLENQNLILYENGPKCSYRKNSKKGKYKIHKDFRLFIIYNPFDVEPNKKLPQSFLNKCLTFSLSSIDKDIETTSLVLSGLFISEKLYKNIIEEDTYYSDEQDIESAYKNKLRKGAIRFANVHNYVNQLLSENKEDFAGKKSFSGRTFNFIMNILKLEPKDIYKGIINVIRYIYCYPYKKPQNNLEKDLINIFFDSPIEDKIMQFLNNDEIKKKEKYKLILQQLKQIVKNPNNNLNMEQFLNSCFAYTFKDISHLILKIEKCRNKLDIDNIYYTYLSIFKNILLLLDKDKKKLDKNLKSKNIIDLEISKENEELKAHQNLLFIYHGLLKCKLIKKISYISFNRYEKLLEQDEYDQEDNNIDNSFDENQDKIKIIEAEEQEKKEENEEEEKEEEDEEEEVSKKISEKEDNFINDKQINGKIPFLELCLENDEEDIIKNIITIAIAYPELNEKPIETLEKKYFTNLPEFKKSFLIFAIRLLNNNSNSDNIKEKEEVLICEKFESFLKRDKDFISAVENTYCKDDLLKEDDQEKNKLKLENCKITKKDLYRISEITLMTSIELDQTIGEIFSQWNNNYQTYFQDLEEIYHDKIGKQNEHKIKKKYDILIKRLQEKKSKINDCFVKSQLNELIDHLLNLKEYKEEKYILAEKDVNSILKEYENFCSIPTKISLIPFPSVEFDEIFEPKTDFQKVYTLLMNYTDSINLLNLLIKSEENRTVINVGKLKKYLNINDDDDDEGIKLQYKLFYKKIVDHSTNIVNCINDFKESVLSNLIVQIYSIDEKYLNKNFIIEELNKFISRNTLNKEEEFNSYLKWASFLSKTKDPFDEITLPIFTAKSIIKLFTLINEEEKDTIGMLDILGKIVNNNKYKFFKEVKKLLDNEKYTHTLSLTIQTILELSIKTIFNDEEHIKNAGEINKLFQKEFIEKVKNGQEVNILAIIKKIKDIIRDTAEKPYLDLLDFFIDLFKYLLPLEENDLSFSQSLKNFDDIIELNEQKVDDFDEDNSDELSKCLGISDLNITKIEKVRMKKFKLDDTFFVTNPDWKNDIKFEYKKYPSLIFFLFKYPECEIKLREYLSQTELIRNNENDKFPTFLLILRIFSDLNCYNLQMFTENFFGSVIKEQILFKFKNTSIKAFQESKDINWLGLLMNNNQSNEYISKKMMKIVTYLENLSMYSFKPDEKSEYYYKIILKDMIKTIFDIILNQKIDNLFSEEIPNLESLKQKNYKSISYFTQLPKISSLRLEEEFNNSEKKNLFNEFKKNIEYINPIYNNNEKIYVELNNAIETDLEAEKLRQIEQKYKNEQNKLESLISEIEGKISGYKESLKNINDNNNLSNNEFNKIIKKIKETEEYLTKINNRYLDRNKIAFECIKIIFRENKKNIIITMGDMKECIEEVKKGSCYYINFINTKKKNFQITAGKNRSLNIKKESLKLYNLNDSFLKKDLENYKNKLKSITKLNIKNININLVIGGEKIENKEKKLKDIMKNLKKDVLKGAIEIISKKGKSQNYSIEDINKVKEKINNLKKIFKSLKDLDFKIPNFINGIGIPTKVEEFCSKYNEFKDMIIGKMESLIKYYDEYDEQKKIINNNSKLFDDSFSLLKFEEKRPKIIDLDIKKSNGFQVNYPYIALYSDSGIEKLQFGQSEYILNIGPVITSLYSGNKINFIIISFVNNNLLAKLNFEEDNDSKELKDYFSIKDKTPPTEPISVIFTVPKYASKENYKLTGKLEIMVEGSKIEPLKIEFLFNVFFLPFEIIFHSKNELFWKENRFHLKKNSFIENEIIEFEYHIRNFENNEYYFLYENYSLKNLDNNEVEKEPVIIQNSKDSNLIKIKLPIIEDEKKFFSGLFTLFFTDKMSIPIEISGYIKKPKFEIYYYDDIYDKIIKNKATIYIYKHQCKKNYFEKNLHFKLQLFDEYKHKFRISIELSAKMEIYISSEKKKVQLDNEKILIADVKEGIYFDIIIKNSKNKLDQTNLEISFILDNEIKKFNIQILFEDLKKDYLDRFYKFPYKIYINGTSDFIKNKNIIKSSKILYNPFCEKLILAQKKIEPGNIDFGKKFFQNLIVFLDDFDNYWIPNDSYFGSDKFDKYKTLEINEENIQLAKEKISNIFNDLYLHDKYRITKFFTYKITYDQLTENKKIEEKKNFLNFISWLVYSKNQLVIKIKNLKEGFEKMGKYVLKDFSPFLKDNYKEDDELCSIIYYNIIIKLRKMFIQRYKILKENDFNLSKVLRKENKPKNNKNRLICFPPFKKEKFINKINEEILKREDYKKEIIESANDWILYENESYPKPIYEKREINEIKDNYSSNIKKVEGKNIDINTDIIKILDLSNANNLDNRISVLNNGFQICKAFMFCIDKLEKNKINETFNYLYEIYNHHKNFNNSILSKEIFMFKAAFESLCITLKNSGVNLSKFELPNLENKNETTQMQKQRPNSFNCTRGIFWSKKKLEKGKSVLDLEKENEVNFPIDDNPSFPIESKNQEKEMTVTPKNIEEFPKMIEKVEFNEVLGRKIDYNNFDLEEEIQDELNVEESENIYLKATGEVKTKKDEEIIKLKSMSDEKAIKFIIKKMIDKNPESNIKTPGSFLEIQDNKNKIFERATNRKEGDDYINQPLFEIINFLSKNLYLKLFQQCVNLERNELCAVIAIDICRTIDQRAKLYHTIIATAMAQLFYSIEIPYSIVVFCDYGVQLIIKNFDDPHSNDISQLIFDSIMVKRFSTRIFDVCYFISKSVNCKNRINKRIFIISNGLDTKLKIGEKWLPLFGNSLEKYCFYFVLPSQCNEDEKNKIIKIWNDFKEKTKVDLAIINLQEILKGSPSTYQEFEKVMHYKMNKNLENEKFKTTHPEFKDVIKFDKEEFMKILSSINSEITSKQSHIYFVQNNYHIPSKNKYIIEDFNIKNPFSTFKGECLDNNYNSQAISEDTKSVLEKLFSSNTTTEMKLEYIEFVFPPNKPTLYSPSTKGSKLYLMGLINFCITHGQDNKIWLEKNRGLKKDYRVSVIIDSSISCFNDFMRPHSIKTVLAVLRMLSLVEIPFFDLIIATSNKPIVLSCGYDTINSLNPKSDLWNLVLEQLTHNENGCNLLNALKVSYKLKSMNSVKKWYCFVLTDGMFEQNEVYEIQDYVSFCEESYIDVFAIGLGYYPEGIKKIFDKCLWCLNPFMILKAMTVFFGNTEKYYDELPLIKLEDQNKEKEAIKSLETIIKKFFSYQEYKNLYGYLDNLPVKEESFCDITNPDMADKIGKENPEISGSNTMCKKGAFEGFKILIGQFWNYSLSKNESEWVDKKYLLERYDKEKECLKEVLDFYSFEIVIKEDYEECILELQTGNYIEHWIICNDGAGKLPNGGNPNLVGQYIEALKIYWNHGGSIIFWNDNEPFTYECNLFLEKAEFPGECTKTKVRFEGNHEGKSIMKPGDINIEIDGKSKFGKFNKLNKINVGKYGIFTLGHNLVKIAEGTSISYVKNPEDIAPFNIFGYEHQGGMNVLFYIPPENYSHGYLVIDGGFTKLFNELDTEGTKRYILNIAAFTTQFYKRVGEIGENWKTDFKIEPFTFNIDKNVIWKGFTNEFDIVYLLDSTGSMGSYLAAARDQCINISEQLKNELPEFCFQFGAVFYRDKVDCPGETYSHYSLKEDVSELKNEIAKETATGGGDGPEDWVGAYGLACDSMAWRSGTRLIIHIADAPAHGSEWCGYSNHDDENEKLYPMIQKCIDKNIKIIGFQIDDSAGLSFNKFKKEYDSKGGILCEIKDFNNRIGSKDISQHFKDLVIESAHAAAPK